LQFHDETIFGMIRFDRKKQNVGRLPVTWWNPSIFGPSFWGDETSALQMMVDFRDFRDEPPPKKQSIVAFFGLVS